jgi:hypothetical protein
MTSKKPEWFELSERDNSAREIRKINKKFPLTVAAAFGAIIVAGSVFANTQSEPAAVAETPITTQTTQAQSAVPAQKNIKVKSEKVVTRTKLVTAQSDPAPVAAAPAPVSALPAPIVASVSNRGDDDEGEGGEHEGREHEGGEGKKQERDDD